jgi:hypothetical protein
MIHCLPFENRTLCGIAFVLHIPMSKKCLPYIPKCIETKSGFETIWPVFISCLGKQEQTVQTSESKDHEIDSPLQRVLHDFIEDQAFSPSYDLAPPLLRPPPQLVSLRAPVELTDGRGVGVGGGAKSYVSEKAWSSINHSILSVPLSSYSTRWRPPPSSFFTLLRCFFLFFTYSSFIFLRISVLTSYFLFFLLFVASSSS